MPLPATPTPKYRVVGDDWFVRVQLTQTNGSPLDLTGCFVAGDVYVLSPPAFVFSFLIAAQVSIVGNDPTLGTIDFFVPRALTPNFSPQDVDSTTSAGKFLNRLVPVVTDSLGYRKSYGPVPIVPLAPGSTRVIPPDDINPIALVVGEQGPSGPMGPIGPEGPPGPAAPSLINALIFG